MLRQTVRSAALIAQALSRPQLALTRAFSVQSSLKLVAPISSIQQNRFYSAKQPLSLKTVEERIKLVLSLYDKIDPSKLTMESDFFKDLGLDSLDHVEIVMAMEDEFGFEIPDGDGDRLKTPRDIFRYMCNVIIQMHSQAVNSSNLINAQNAVCITLNNELEMRRNQYNTLARIQLRELLIHTSKMLHRGCRRSRFGRLYEMDGIDLSKTAIVKKKCQTSQGVSASTSVTTAATTVLPLLPRILSTICQPTMKMPMKIPRNRRRQ